MLENCILALNMETAADLTKSINPTPVKSPFYLENRGKGNTELPIICPKQDGEWLKTTNCFNGYDMALDDASVNN
jgi:hypothetical protein